MVPGFGRRPSGIPTPIRELSDAPSAEWLLSQPDRVAPDNDGRYDGLDPSAVPVAKWLESQGYTILAVRHTNDWTGGSPDMIARSQTGGPWLTVETKELRVGRWRAVRTATRKGKTQSNHIVVDARRGVGQSRDGFTDEMFERGMRDAVRQDGNRFDTLIILTSDEDGLRWDRG